MALFSLLAMIIIAKKLITPITKLTDATKRVGQEDFPENLNITRKDEIGQLATSFQSMIHKLSENDRLRKEFISDVSHDFQTRSEEHTSELQSRGHLVCRLLLEKKT